MSERPSLWWALFRRPAPGHDEAVAALAAAQRRRQEAIEINHEAKQVSARHRVHYETNHLTERMIKMMREYR